MPGPGHLEAADIARRELRLFLSMAAQSGMDTNRQHRSLLVSLDDWHRWLGILHDAPLPSRPGLPLLLRRLGYVTSRLERAPGLPVHAEERAYPAVGTAGTALRQTTDPRPESVSCKF
jgi:hypothetical protein